MKRPSKKGQAITIELALTALLMVIFCILGFDMFFVVFGFTRLDSAARDAARAAGSTTGPGQGLVAAILAAKTYQTDGYFVTQPGLFLSPTGGTGAPTNPGVSQMSPVGCNNWYGATPLADPAGTGIMGLGSDFNYVQNPAFTVPPALPSGSPYVTVTTRCKVSVPFGINFFGSGASLPQGGIA